MLWRFGCVPGHAQFPPCPRIGAGSCERATGSGGAQRPRSGAAGALDAAARERMMGQPGQGMVRGDGGGGQVSGAGPSLGVDTGGRAMRARRGDGEGQPGLPRPAGTRAVPGDMMIDRVSPAGGGCGRSVFGGRPRALRGRAVAADSPVAGAGRGDPHRVMMAPLPCPRTASWRGHRGGLGSIMSASSPSPARMCTAWRMILRASERAARLPSRRSLAAA